MFLLNVIYYHVLLTPYLYTTVYDPFATPRTGSTTVAPISSSWPIC